MNTLYKDYRRYRATGKGQGSFLGTLMLTQGLWATAVYRVARAIHIQQKPPVIRHALQISYLFFHKWMEILTGICLPAECEVGEGLYIGHFGPIIVHPKAKIGRNCNLSQGVTIGILQRGKRQGVPILGDRVYIGPNSVIIGAIVIGNDVAIGAGSVLVQSIPDRAVVAGNPARILSYEGSFEFITYDGMESDLERQGSLHQRELLEVQVVP